jgi:hypothetical protein
VARTPLEDVTAEETKLSISTGVFVPKGLAVAPEGVDRPANKSALATVATIVVRLRINTPLFSARLRGALTSLNLYHVVGSPQNRALVVD